MAIIKSVLLGSVAALAGLGFVSAGCSGPVIDSISYCNSVDKITYNSVGYSGTYDDVTGMDLNSCTCSYTKKAFSGPLAPLDEGLSFHVRGPVHLKRFAVYQPGALSKRDVHNHHKRHGHHAYNKRAMEIKTVTSTIVVDQDGNTIFPKPTGQAERKGEGEKGDVELHAVPTPEPSSKPGNNGNGNGGNNGSGSGEDGDKEEDNKDDDKDDEPAAGNWVRRAFYDAGSQVSNGLVFMNHRGGQGSGTFDQNCGGLSISYMSPDSKTGSAKPQLLHNAPIKTRDEFIIFSDEKCDSECGFYRPGIPAYKGFGGKQKAFLFEFTMPSDETSDSFNNDMPALWMLNSKIPRTAQYGLKDKPCSCWGSGCGELDVFEVLQGAKNMVKTHYHSQQGAQGPYGGGGSVDYFDRPYDKPVTVAVVFDPVNKAVTITKLPSGTAMPDSFDGSYLEKLKGGDQSNVSVFNVPS